MRLAKSYCLKTTHESLCSQKKLNVFLGDHRKKIPCRQCFNSNKSENMLIGHKPKSEKYDIFTIRTSSESLLHWKDHFHKIPLQFRIIAAFEV